MNDDPIGPKTCKVCRRPLEVAVMLTHVKCSPLGSTEPMPGAVYYCDVGCCAHDCIEGLRQMMLMALRVRHQKGNEKPGAN